MLQKGSRSFDLYGSKSKNLQVREVVQRVAANIEASPCKWAETMSRRRIRFEFSSQRIVSVRSIESAETDYRRCWLFTQQLQREDNKN